MTDLSLTGWRCLLRTLLNVRMAFRSICWAIPFVLIEMRDGEVINSPQRVRHHAQQMVFEVVSRQTPEERPAEHTTSEWSASQTPRCILPLGPRTQIHRSSSSMSTYVCATDDESLSPKLKYLVTLQNMAHLPPFHEPTRPTGARLCCPPYNKFVDLVVFPPAPPRYCSCLFFVTGRTSICEGVLTVHSRAPPPAVQVRAPRLLLLRLSLSALVLCAASSSRSQGREQDETYKTVPFT